MFPYRGLLEVPAICAPIFKVGKHLTVSYNNIKVVNGFWFHKGMRLRWRIPIKQGKSTNHMQWVRWSRKQLSHRVYLCISKKSFQLFLCAWFKSFTWVSFKMMSSRSWWSCFTNRLSISLSLCISSVGWQGAQLLLNAPLSQGDADAPWSSKEIECPIAPRDLGVVPLRLRPRRKSAM